MDAEQTQFAGRSKHGAKEGRTLPEKMSFLKWGMHQMQIQKYADALGIFPTNV